MKQIAYLSIAAAIAASTSPFVATSSQNFNSIPYKGYVNTQSIASKNSSINITSKDVNTKDELTEIDLKIPVVSGLKDLNLQKKINSMFEKDAISFKNEIEEMAKEYFEECKKYDISMPNYSAVVNYKILSKDNNLLSMYIDYYRYTGGAHGSTTRKSYNIDLNTGKVLDLKDIFKGKLDYKGIIDKTIKNEISRNPNLYFSEDFKGISDNPCFVIENSNLIIYFQQYEIAPYSSGIPQFNIPLSKFKTN